MDYQKNTQIFELSKKVSNPTKTLNMTRYKHKKIIKIL